MNLSHLTVFREVMLSGSVSQAARNLGRTQPAISATLAALEEDIGQPLFERRGRRLHPVPEAHYLLSEATQILDHLKSTERNLRNLKSLQTGELRIAAMPGPSVFLLPRLISRFTKARGDIRVTILTRSSPQVHQLLSTQSFDFGVADLGVDYTVDTALVRAEPVANNCVCALPADDPLIARSVIRPTDLHNRPLAMLNPDHQTHRMTRKAFEDAGAGFRVRFETQYFLPLLNFVEDGLACAVVDTLSAESYRRYRGGKCGLVFRPFEPRIPLSFATLIPAHRTQSQLARAFGEAWRAEVAEINALWQDGAAVPPPNV